MKATIVLVTIFILTGCANFLGMGSKSKVEPTQPELIEQVIDVEINRLFRAAVQEFRNIRIMEADKEEFYIKAVQANVLIEFKAYPGDTAGNSLFTVRAVTLNGELRLKVARKFSKLVYSRAKSLWLAIDELIGKTDY